MIRSNALFIAIIIALIIGVITSSFVLLSMHYRFYMRKNLMHNRLELNSASGVELLLAESDLFDLGESKVMDLFETGKDSVILKKIRWGLFDIGISKSFGPGGEQTKIFQIGSKPEGIADVAIYLVDEGAALAISGKTILKGTCYLPEAGIKSAQVSGNFFSGNKFVNGAIKRSAAKLPPVNKGPIETIIRLFKTKPDSLSLLFNITSEQTDSLSRSFQDTTLLIRQSGPLTLSRKYSGNILFMSDTLVTIESEAVLKDVIVVAPDIIIREGFKGNLQAFAFDTIALEKDCNLMYPSVLAIIKKDFSAVDQPSILLQSGSEFSGFIFSYQVVEDLRRTLIKVEAGSEISGQIYSDGYLEMRGAVTGGVICKKFVLNTPSSFYENHLLNATIDNTTLSTHYLAPPMLESRRKKNIVKWLD